MKYRTDYATLKKTQSTKYADYYRDPGKYYIPPFAISDTVYYVGDKKVCSHLVDTGKGLVLFDSGFPHTAHLQIQSIWEAGFNPRDIVYVIHSHEHFDHIGAANEFKNLYGCKLAISAGGARVMEEHPEWTFLQEFPNPNAYLFTPDLRIDDGDEITLGGTRIRCVATPGHSEGVMSFFFETTWQGKPYQVGYFGGMGFNTLFTEALEECGRPLTTQQEFVRSIDRVIEEPVDIVLGNHPRQNNTLEKREKLLQNPEKNPFIDHTEWKSSMEVVRQEFLEFLASGH